MGLSHFWFQQSVTASSLHPCLCRARLVQKATFRLPINVAEPAYTQGGNTLTLGDCRQPLLQSPILRQGTPVAFTPPRARQWHAVLCICSQLPTSRSCNCSLTWSTSRSRAEKPILNLAVAALKSTTVDTGTVQKSAFNSTINPQHNGTICKPLGPIKSTHIRTCLITNR